MQKKPRLWIAGFSNVAVKRAARVGAGYIAIVPVGPFTKVYRETFAEAGGNPVDAQIAAGYAWAVPPGMHPTWSDEHVEQMSKEVMPAFR